MKKINSLFIYGIIIFASFYIVDAIALEKESHKFLNEKIIEQNKETLSAFLNSNLGFSDGIKQILNGQEVVVWFREGGRQEDEPVYSRSFNHFHDPLQPWYLAGFDKTFKSSLIWAQDQGTIGSLLGGDWSWKKARDSFHKGLTSINKTEKEKNLADTFRALGQIMHLIQDGSVPAHVRNDSHVYIDLFGKKIGKYHYEVWVNDNLQKINLSPQAFNKAIFNIIPEATAPIPIANIFDTNKYYMDGSNPEIATGSSIGITEYTNANFFSEGTIFKQYPHPSVADTNFQNIDFKNPEVVDAEDGKLDNRIYIRKVAGEQVQRLASLSYVSRDLIMKGFYQFSPLVLDDKVYEEYASKLIPRAVGYSAGLLEYFFRGKLQVTTVPIFYKNAIVYLRAKIKNITPNEIMRDGEFTLTYSYRPTGGNPDGSQDIWGQSPVSPSGTLLYDGEETVIDFWMPYPIPKENYDSAKFTLAFKGTLGNEVGAVIGKVHSLGEIKFGEEWDNGLIGNHAWGHTGYNLFGQNPDNGSTSNVIFEDTLVKDNIRYAGQTTARVNQSLIDYYYNNGQFRDILPILITPDTYLQFKIDAMSINAVPPAPPGQTNQWQYLMFHFNNGYNLQYSHGGQGVYLGSKTAYYDFSLGWIIVDNIYEAFKWVGITLPDGPLYLEGISLVQQLNLLGEPSAVEHHQHMEVDSIRIVEGKKQ